MKILLLSDIHANWPALAAVRESFDACLFAGDLVDYATDPLPCIEWVRKNALASVRGNHDHAVAQRVPVHGTSGLKLLTSATREFHWKVLGTSHLRFLSKLPVTKYLTLDGKRFLLIHGTPRDPLDEYLMADPEAWSQRLATVDVDFVCVGHTHIPFHLQLERQQVVNPGSVGQPRDGDPRCSYAVIDNGVVEIRRVEYDIDATLRQMQESHLDDGAIQVAEAMLRSGGILMENPRDVAG